MHEVWLTTAYLGPLEYFRLLADSRVVWLETHEHYIKQSWRNRFRILSANGPLSLSIPILNGTSPGQPIREVRIDNRQPWQKIHWRSVEAAYRHAPYYEYFIDDLRPLWTDEFESLFDYNLLGIKILMNFLKTGTDLRFTDGFQPEGHYGVGDYRYVLHPKSKKEGTGFEPVPYHQVFSDRFGFVQGLSVIDWLFNDFRI